MSKCIGALCTNTRGKKKTQLTYVIGNVPFYIISMKTNVLKTGSDRPVRPVEPSTGHKIGLVQSKNRFCIETVLNRPNRRSDR